MKKQIFKLLLSIILSIEYCNCNGQNIVPNNSFESYIATYDSTIQGCLLATGGFNLGQIPPWDSPTDGSPDPYNSCSPPFSSAGVPYNGLGYQFPKTGNGYGGQAFYSYTDGFREYMQVELDTTLIVGRTYCASFYVNLLDSCKIGCNNFGVYFSNTHTYVSTTTALGLIPQINYANVVLDTANWVLISGQYIAQGGEKYIIIGNFFPNATTQTTIVSTSGAPWQHQIAYYFIDDVSIFEIDNHIAGNDTIICLYDSVQLGIGNNQGLSYEWQPSTGLSNASIGNPMASPSVTTTYYLNQTTACGIIKDTITVIIDPCGIGMNEPGMKNSIRLYPNPNDGNMYFAYKLNSLTDRGVFIIYDITGKLITQYPLNGNTQLLNITEKQLNNGVYFYKVIINDELLNTDKFVIIK